MAIILIKNMQVSDCLWLRHDNDDDDDNDDDNYDDDDDDDADGITIGDANHDYEWKGSN